MNSSGEWTPNPDWVVEQTTRRGLVAIVNPIWKKQLADAIRDNGSEKSRAYGRWFAGRYKDNPRVIYFLGGNAVPDPVRRQAWWASFLTGSAGHAYGVEAIWHHNRDGETWRAALQYPSRQDMTHKKSFLDPIPWWTLRPDMENEVLVGGYGTWRTDEFAVAAISEDRKLAVAYTPVRHALQFQLSGLASGKVEARWFDPTSGVFSSPGGWNDESRGLVTIQSPERNSAGDEDYVLILTVQ